MSLKYAADGMPVITDVSEVEDRLRLMLRDGDRLVTLYLPDDKGLIAKMIGGGVTAVSYVGGVLTLEQPGGDLEATIPAGAATDLTGLSTALDGGGQAIPNTVRIIRRDGSTADVPVVVKDQTARDAAAAADTKAGQAKQTGAALEASKIDPTKTVGAVEEDPDGTVTARMLLRYASGTPNTAIAENATGMFKGLATEKYVDDSVAAAGSGGTAPTTYTLTLVNRDPAAGEILVDAANSRFDWSHGQNRDVAPVLRTENFRLSVVSGVTSWMNAMVGGFNARLRNGALNQPHMGAYNRNTSSYELKDDQNSLIGVPDPAGTKQTLELTVSIINDGAAL